MRALLPIAVAVALAGCATHRAHVASEPADVHDWAAVLAVPAHTFVSAALDDDHVSDGYLVSVTDTTLTIRRRDSTRQTIPRATVVRVETTVRLKNSDAMNGFPIGVGTVGGLAGTLIGVATDNSTVKGWSLAVLGTSLVAGFAYMHRHPAWEPDYVTRVVYVR